MNKQETEKAIDVVKTSIQRLQIVKAVEKDNKNLQGEINDLVWLKEKLKDSIHQYEDIYQDWMHLC